MTRLTTVLGVAAYIAVLHVAYVLFISPRWLPSGLVYRPGEDGAVIVAHVLAFLPGLAMPVGAKRPSDAVVWVLYTIAYIPSVLVPQFVMGAGWSLMPFTLVLATGFGLVLAHQRLPPVTVGSPLRSFRAHAVVSAGLGALLFAVILVSFGLRFEIPDLGNVYDVRDDYRDALSTTGRLPAYAVGWSGSAVNPMLVAIGLAIGVRSLVAAGVLGEIAIFTVTGFKSILFSGPLVIPLAVVLRSAPSRFGVWAIWGLVGSVVVACGVQAITGWTLLADIFVRRLIVVPGQLSGYYVDFFSRNPTYGLSHSILGWVNQQPYPENQARTIAYVYFGHPEASSNANLWADGYANFGLPGVLAASVLCVLLLWAMNSISADRPLWITGSVLATASVALTNSALLTSVLSHGIAVAMLLVLLLPRSEARSAEPVASRVTGATALLPVRRADSPVAT